MGTLRLGMKAFTLLLLVLCSSAEWTCDDCEKAGEDLGILATSQEALDVQTAILVAELCPQAEDPATCEEQLPPFWGELAKVIWPGHFSYMCSDMCPPPIVSLPKANIPNCEECAVRINGSFDYLAHDDTIDTWVNGLTNEWWFCESVYPTNVDECKEGIKVLVPQALPIFVNQDRGWVTDFCNNWGCEV